MSDVEYWIYSGSEPVTNAMNSTLNDLDVAKQLAQEISEHQPGATITIVSRKPENMGEWTRHVAQFLDGKPYPSRWQVDFFGHLMDQDRARLQQAGVTWTHGNTEISPTGALRPGLARNTVEIDAD